MPQITLVLTTQSKPVPDGTTQSQTTPGNYRFHALQAGAVVQSIDQADKTCVFPADIPAGDYTFQAIKLDDAGNPYGDVAAIDYTVTAGVATPPTNPVQGVYDAPVSLTVTQA